MRLPNKLEFELEKCLGAKGERLSGSVRDLVSVFKQALQANEEERVAACLRRVVMPTLDYTSAQHLLRVFRKLPPRLASLPTIRLAVLSSFTSDQLTQLVELFLFAMGIRAEIWEADYGVFRQEILFPDSQLYAFRPQVVFMATSWRDVGNIPRLEDDAAQVKARVEDEVASWYRLWKTVHDRSGCQVIQNNFDLPPWRVLGNHEVRHPAGFGRYIGQVNASFGEQSPAYVTIHDLEGLAASHGRWNFGDERFFHSAKIPCAPEFLVDYAHSVASLIAAQQGLGKKCLVLDLDNTLWGGVIGDDGLGGIRLGQGDAEGESFLAFQRYVKGLQLRGVILAVCSKNDERVAREVFEKHPEMVLRFGDISCFVANWQDKASNLRMIAQQLNIGLNSLVFVDDNPAERSVVRQLVPEVAVPEMPSDPSYYVRELEQHRYFQMVSVTTEDFQRTQFYQAKAAREQAEVGASNVEDFLKSLQMTARIGPIDATTLERSAQLISRSNQFNLTTRRRSSAELLAIQGDEQWLTRTVSLADRFGDHGLISVVLAKVKGCALEIDTWLMSCRVLKRGVEDFLLNHLFDIALDRGLKTIRGEYIPTAKNVLVRDHYEKLGFTQTQASEEGRWWELPVIRARVPQVHYIREV